jgi:hypothetical protein
LSQLRTIAATVLLCTLVLLPFHPASPLAPQAATWYVRPGGNDGGVCNVSTTPCATIQAAIDKAAAGDTILVAAATYHGTGNVIVTINKSLRVLGGWNAAFTAVTGYARVNGDGWRSAVAVSAGVVVELDRFDLQYGYHFINENIGGGLHNEGTLTVTNSLVRDSSSFGNAGGVSNWGGNLTLQNTIVAYNSGGGILNQSYYHGGGVLTLTNVVLAYNGGGGLYNHTPDSSVYINNSFIFENHSAFRAGVQNAGLMRIHNSTIWRNTAEYQTGGLVNEGGTLVVANTALGHNETLGVPSDCGGEITSLGYNLVEIGCGFVTATGDQVNLPPGLVVIGNLVAPVAGSPAIDGGNPAGCLDSSGALFTTDQRGTARPLDGDENTSAICDIGGYEFDPDQPVVQAFMPSVTRDYCVDFKDGFDNPGSGWPVGENSRVGSEYAAGEYRVFTKDLGYAFLFRAPTCARLYYSVEVDVRWMNALQGQYGLIFGATSDWSKYYLFAVDSDEQVYRLYRRNPNGSFELLYSADSNGIAPGTEVNHLRITHLHGQVLYEVNGYLLGWHYYDYGEEVTGPTWAGLVVITSGGNFDLDARFDNFKIETAEDDGSFSHTLADTEAAGPQMPAPPTLVDQGDTWFELWP